MGIRPDDLGGAAPETPEPYIPVEPQPFDERKQATVVANRLLDEPGADPDDDLRILARQFVRTCEQVAKLRDAAHDVETATHGLRLTPGLKEATDYLYAVWKETEPKS